MPRSRSSGALSIWSNGTNVAPPVFASTFVVVAVNVVFPWSTCPIVPTLQCGFFRSNFCFDISSFLRVATRSGADRLGRDLLRDRLRRLIVVRELHGVGRA